MSHYSFDKEAHVDILLNIFNIEIIYKHYRYIIIVYKINISQQAKNKYTLKKRLYLKFVFEEYPAS